ncbi:nucleotidyltransferase [Chryseobacterium indologenes]|uniref:nucleotidyltransferase n=1 Tax=Chryseobacterium indologenes TaxID=253 RepID=UPI001D0D666E|nr:nucleotidyltransferase [Chryseobacterium indologenes]UDQ54984.1 nucleotidyltransferase [Chryseobacterium indologenes]
MRTIDEIYNTLIENKSTYPALDDLDTTSKTAIWKLILWIFAYAIYVHERIFDQYKKEVSVLIQEEKAHSERWYRSKALAFQYGFLLLKDDDQFNNVGYDNDRILASKIIKYSAVTPSADQSRLIIKIATESGGKLSPITEDQKKAFEFYISEIKDAGVQATVVNFLPDKLQLFFKIKRDPNVIDSNGVSIINGNEPVKDALNKLLKELPFNGELVLNTVVDRLQIIEGVINPHLIAAKTSWIDPEVGDYGAVENIDISKIPVSGYFEIDYQNSDIQYVV